MQGNPYYTPDYSKYYRTWSDEDYYVEPEITNYIRENIRPIAKAASYLEPYFYGAMIPITYGAFKKNLYDAFNAQRGQAGVPVPAAPVPYVPVPAAPVPYVQSLAIEDVSNQQGQVGVPIPAVPTHTATTTRSTAMIPRAISKSVSFIRHMAPDVVKIQPFPFMLAAMARSMARGWTNPREIHIKKFNRSTPLPWDVENITKENPMRPDISKYVINYEPRKEEITRENPVGLKEGDLVPVGEFGGHGRVHYNSEGKLVMLPYVGDEIIKFLPNYPAVQILINSKDKKDEDRLAKHVSTMINEYGFNEAYDRMVKGQSVGFKNIMDRHFSMVNAPYRYVAEGSYIPKIYNQYFSKNVVEQIKKIEVQIPKPQTWGSQFKEGVNRAKRAGIINPERFIFKYVMELHPDIDAKAIVKVKFDPSRINF